jgi:hypothetical protein
MRTSKSPEHQAARATDAFYSNPRSFRGIEAENALV